jgi:hypothetical protein
MRGKRRPQRVNRTHRGWRRLYGSFFARLGRWLGAKRFGPGSRLCARRLGGFGVFQLGLACERSFGFFIARCVRRAVSTRQAAAQLERDVVVERTRMRFLVRDSELG